MLFQNRYRVIRQSNRIFNMALPVRISESGICRRLTSIELNKQKLPKHPVPDLNQTAERYLRSLKPLLSKQEYCNTEKLVQDFISENGIGKKLQEKLLQRYEKTESWMSQWFLHTAYLGYRDSVLLMSSPGTVGPHQDFNSPQDLQKFAAQLIAAVCVYNDLVKKGEIKQEMVGKTPLDMQPYAMILGTHRLPAIPFDKLVHTDDSHHVIILRNNNIFKLSVYDDDGTPLKESKLIPAIRDIFECSEKDAIPVGIMSGNQRDTWAKDFENLKNIGCNSKILKDIEEALFILCLDKNLPRNELKDNCLSVRARQALTGYSIETNAGNRWHDKTLQFILSLDGFIGIEYEHSPCEGGPIGVIKDFVLKYVENNKNCNQEENLQDYPKAELLKFEVNSEIEKSIDEAKRFVNKMCNNIDMECFVFTMFGTDEIKKFKMSPDSFIQIAMQVTYYKLHGKPPAHYESGGLRRFKDTRTEAIRSTSIESVAFAKLMTHGGSSGEKKEALVNAINAHKRIAGEAVTGAGVDRHLYGLKMIALEQNMGLPKLYQDIGFIRSCNWNLTSSQVPFKTASFMCYGPVIEEGYGCCYNPRPKDILVACSSFKSCTHTCTREFAEMLQQTFCDMKDVAAC